jgi:hypothetical protein
MILDSEPIYPDPRHDPEFSLGGSGPGKRARELTMFRQSFNREGTARRRSSMLAIVLAAVWLVLLIDPMVGPLLLTILAMFGLALLVMAGAMGLGVMGFGLFAAGDRLIALLRHGTRWPEE